MENNLPVEVILGDEWELEDGKWVREGEGDKAMRIPDQESPPEKLEQIKGQIETFFDEGQEDYDPEEETVGNDHPQTCYCSECVPTQDRQR